MSSGKTTQGGPVSAIDAARRTVAVIVTVLGLTTCSGPPATVEAIRAAGELRIATVAGGSTWFEGPEGHRGFEHDLTREFAEYIGVEPRYVVAASYAELPRLVQDNRAHLAAALLPIHNRFGNTLSFGPSYATLRQAIVYRHGRDAPASVEDLRGGVVAAPLGRGARTVLERELPQADGYEWAVLPGRSIEELLEMLDAGKVDFALVPEEEFEAARLYFPELRQGFTLGAPQAVGWLYRPGPKNSLWDVQLAFLNAVRESGELQILRDRYFGHFREFDYVEARAFLRHYAQRLPTYRDAFEAQAERFGLDWLMLAAMSYQESHWNKDARSPTGVRGLMMLTRRTARALDVDRLDPFESIRGGAQYLARLRDRLPERIAEPDRTWLALAAYNVGLAHLEDARRFTDGAGRDPDRWLDVRDFLPKLANRQWAKRARHGYARGYQAVHFVENIRRYYDVLRWLEADSTTRETAKPPPTLFAPVLPRSTSG